MRIDRNMIKEKNIAVFVKNLTSGGAEKQSVIQAKLLAKSYSVHYIIFNGAKVHDKYLRYLENGNNVETVLFNGSHFHRFYSFIKYLREKRIDVIFSYLTAANLYCCLASLFCKAKVIVGLRNAKLPFGKLIVDRFLTNHVATLAVSNSYAGKEEFSKKGFKSKKIRVIPNCFDNIAQYSPKEKHEQIGIVTVGRFVKQKDYETAIAAVSLVAVKYSKIRYTIIGYGELENDVRNWVKQYDIENNIKILINPDNIESYLLQNDIYLSTSLFEGTSNSIMEAMNADLPIVCTDAGDNRQLVHDGENGYVCAKGDHKKIADRIIELIEDDEKRILFGKKSKEILVSYYGSDFFCERYIQLLKEF